jgi:hypothetical protein
MQDAGIADKTVTEIQSGCEKHGQKGNRDWHINKCLIP